MLRKSRLVQFEEGGGERRKGRRKREEEKEKEEKEEEEEEEEGRGGGGGGEEEEGEEEKIVPRLTKIPNIRSLLRAEAQSPALLNNLRRGALHQALLCAPHFTFIHSLATGTAAPPGREGPRTSILKTHCPDTDSHAPPEGPELGTLFLRSPE